MSIEEAINFLRDNGYYVTKDVKMCDVAEECCETGRGDCIECSQFVCLCGNNN